MYLVVNIPHHIATLDSVLLLTSYHMISQILKCTGSTHHLMMHLHGPQISSILLL